MADGDNPPAALRLHHFHMTFKCGCKAAVAVTSSAGLGRWETSDANCDEHGGNGADKPVLRHLPLVLERFEFHAPDPRISRTPAESAERIYR